MKNDSPSKTNDKTAAERAQIEAEEKQAAAILTQRIERASGKASGVDYVPNAANPVALN